MSDGFVEKMFETKFGFASAINVHGCDKLSGELDAAQCSGMASIDNCL